MRRNNRLLREICRFLYFRRRSLLCAVVTAVALTVAAVTAFAAEDLSKFLESLSLHDAAGNPVQSGDSVSFADHLEIGCELWNIAVTLESGGTKLYFEDPVTAGNKTEIKLNNEPYDLKLPTYLQCASFQPFEIKSGGITVATVSRKADDTVTLVFDTGLPAALAAIGITEIRDIVFRFAAALDATEVGQRNEVTIDLDSNHKVTVNITDNAPKDAALASKACKMIGGEPKLDPATGRFHWTVTIDPETPVTDPTTGTPNYKQEYVFKDVLGTAQTYVDGTFNIKWGQNPEATRTPTYDKAANTLEYIFTGANEVLNAPVTITYDTEPSDGLFYDANDPQNHALRDPKGVTVNNTATLYKPAPDGTPVNSKSGTAKYTGDAWLEKTSGVVDRLNKTIDWTLTVKTNGRGFAKIDVYDTLDAALTYDGNFSVKDGAGNPVSITANAAFNGKGSGEVPENRLCTISPVDKSTYTITYRTSFPNTPLDHNNPTGVTNKAWLAFEWDAGSGPGPGTEYGIPEVVKPVQLGTSIVAKSGKYDPATTRIKWEVTVNANRLNITNATITDTVMLTNQSGVLTAPTVIAPSAECTAYDGTAKPDYMVTMTRRGTSGVYDVVLNRNGGSDNALGTDTVVITYYTRATDPAFYANNATATFENTATVANISLANPQQPSLPGPFSATAKPTGTSRVLDKDAVSYDYNTNEITWKLTVNANKMDLTNVVITDALPSYLSFESNSATYSPGTHAQPIESGNTLTFNFAALTDTLTIQFRTKLDVNATNLPGGFQFGKNNTAGGAAPLKIDNTASLESNEYPGGVVAEGGDIPIDNKLLVKQGTPGAPGCVHYTIELNQNGADLRLAYPGGVFLTDALPSNLFVDLEDVHLYEASVDAGGAFIKGTVEEPLTYRQKQLVPPNNLQVTLPDSSKRYILEYDAYILVTAGGQVTLQNSAGFGPDGKSGGQSISTSATASSAGSANLIPGKSALKITKTDAADPTLVLPGAVYGLYAPIPNSQETYLFQIATTAIDANGDASATFVGLTQNRVYTLKELTAPPGYTLAAPILVTAGATGTELLLPVQDVKWSGIGAMGGAEAGIPMAGDGARPWLWAGLMLLAAAGLFVRRMRAKLNVAQSRRFRYDKSNRYAHLH